MSSGAENYLVPIPYFISIAGPLAYLCRVPDGSGTSITNGASLEQFYERADK